jgi:uncharacterized protein YkwD
MNQNRDVYCLTKYMELMFKTINKWRSQQLSLAPLSALAPIGLRARVRAQRLAEQSHILGHTVKNSDRPMVAIR